MVLSHDPISDCFFTVDTIVEIPERGWVGTFFDQWGEMSGLGCVMQELETSC
jgi:hypothetical protein